MLLYRLTERLQFLVFQLETGGGIDRPLTIRADLEDLRALEGGVQDDVGIASFTLELQQEELVGRHADGREFDRHPLAALGTAHLLLDATNNQLEGVGIHFHQCYSTMSTARKESFLGNLSTIASGS